MPYDEPDRLNVLPHPREMLGLVGHRQAEAEFLAGWTSGRLHHAWMLTGEEGIGKATLAYRIARFVLSPREETGADPSSLAVPDYSRTAQQIAAGAHPDLAVIRRTYNVTSKSVYTEIRVDDVRKSLEVFSKTAAFGGYRVCIVDCCDELNASSANALLKTLEEPPSQSLFLLVAHQPGRLLPTIRSRVRMLGLSTLAIPEVETVLAGLEETASKSDEMRHKAAARSDGSVRRAVTLLSDKMLSLIDHLEALLGELPSLDGAKVDSLADMVPGRAGDDAYALILDVCGRWIEQRLREQPDARLHRLVAAWSKIEERRRAVNGLNLDRRAFVLEVLTSLATASRP